MREIEFRGKLTNSINEYTPAGSWVYGGYYFWRHGACIHEKDAAIGLYVDRETIGQYTGLKDRNGVKIFEGDVILWRHTESSGLHCKQNTVVSFAEGIIVSRRIDSFYPGGLEPNGSYLYYMCSIFDKAIQEYPQRNYCYEVIGNIHDNPELLEERK